MIHHDVAKDKASATAQEKAVAQELGSGVLYADSMCAASDSCFALLTYSLFR